jgi:hypothetical protein
LESLDVRESAQHLLRLFVGLLLVVEGLVLVPDLLHVRVLLLLVGDRPIDPLVMSLRGQRADEDRILALAAHAAGEPLH